MPVLSDEQKATLARRMYKHLSSGFQKTVIVAFAERFSLTQRGVTDKLLSHRDLREQESQFVIETIWGMVSVRSLRDFFVELFGQQPEYYGYAVPATDPLPLDTMTDFDKFKAGLGKVVKQRKSATL